MNAADIFAPIAYYQMEHGKKTTSKQIAQDTGLTEKRVGQLRKDPNRATVAELEALTREYHFQIRLGDKGWKNQ